MAKISKIAKRLFSQNLILKKLPSGRFTLVDFDKIQSFGMDGFNKGPSFKRGFGGSFFNSGYSTNSTLVEVDALRNKLYIDYELMDSDAILSSALDIYADEATVNNEYGYVLEIKSDNPDIKKLLNNLFYDVLNIEFNLWHWVRSLCKHGDLFLWIPSLPEVGVINAIPIHPSLVTRDDYAGENEDETRYLYTGEGNYGGGYSSRQDEFEYHEVAHFRLLSDMNFMPYGKSMLEGARKDYKKLSLMEDAMLIHRIMRAPERRIFKIDIGNIAPEAVDSYMETISNEMKKIPYIDPETGDYDLRFNLMNMLEDYYLPVRGGDSGTEIETLPGLGANDDIEDINYIKDKILAHLKIPKAYLGYDEGIDGKGTLAAEDIRFARFIGRIQKILVSELTKIAYIHLYMQGFSRKDMLNFDLELSTPSLIYERQRIDLLNEKINMVNNILDKNLFSRKYIYETIFNFNEEEWRAQEDRIIEDLKLQFRHEQIANEGNDPAQTGEAVGTAHSIASLHVQNRYKQEQENSKLVQKTYEDPLNPDMRHENPGRPEKYGSYGRAKDSVYGVDPDGRKEFETPLNAGKEYEKLKKSLKLLDKSNLNG